ncbi:Glycosyltransferase involved in cell wall bisynthesis [Polaromonas sp. YR568]|uniref:glycosyltransferase n=1 Tax=Polaromonas sp. YR568 TaxID=1855301 RepID=UPI0008E779FF|nr:glycosyltransferase [Polaromonas sp. YR568]SFU91794.1 Glycosyltransferase involved in cell wall bisynthesis [Polaromonas sp. YR568]
MKVLNVNHLLDPETGGGTAERTLQISRFLQRAGIQTSILALDIGLSQTRREKFEGVKVVTLPCLNRRYFVPWPSQGVIHKLVADADVVHLSGHWTILNALVYKSCRRQGKPFVFCPAGALATFGRSLRLKRTYDAWIGRELAQSATACVAITHQERADFAAYGVSAERVTVIPNGIDPGQYATGPAAEREIREHLQIGPAPYILFLGRLNAIKGPDLLLEAFLRVASRFPEFHLVFVGPDGGLQASLMENAGQSPQKERVHFPGYLAGADKAAALKAATLLVIPSRREAMSIVVLEAGISGTPTLFTNACGLEGISALGAGTMVEPSAEALATGLTALLADPTSTRAAAVRLEALVREKYQWAMQAASYVTLYEQILGKAHA